MLSIHTQELSWIENLHQLIRSSSADIFFKLLNFIDTQEFAFILVPLIWMCWNWKWGARFFYIIILNGLVNHFFKQWFEQPRPFHINPSLGVIYVKDYGFPSGAAQTAILLSGILIREWKSKWSWIIGLNFFFWLSFSRVYLGVHFPTDILGGWCIGAGLLGVFYFVRPKFENYLSQQPISHLFAISQGIPLLLLFSYPSLSMIHLMFATMGVGLGLVLSLRYPQFQLSYKSWSKRILQSALAICGGFTIFYLLSSQIAILVPFFRLQVAIQYTLIGFWLSFGVQLCAAPSRLTKEIID